MIMKSLDRNAIGLLGLVVRERGRVVALDVLIFGVNPFHHFAITVLSSLAGLAAAGAWRARS